jgi:hypothetical protein
MWLHEVVVRGCPTTVTAQDLQAALTIEDSIIEPTLVRVYMKKRVLVALIEYNRLSIV